MPGLFPFSRQLITHCLKVVAISPFSNASLRNFSTKYFNLCQKTFLKIQMGNHQYQDIFHCPFFKDSPILFIVKGPSISYDSLADNFLILLLKLLLLKSGLVKESSLFLTLFKCELSRGYHF